MLMLEFTFPRREGYDMKSTCVSPRGDTCYFSVGGQPIYISIKRVSDTKQEVKMTKLLALLCLVLSVLLTVSRCTESEGEIIVKDGHRVVVVEYDADGKTNTSLDFTAGKRTRADRRPKRNV